MQQMIFFRGYMLLINTKKTLEVLSLVLHWAMDVTEVIYIHGSVECEETK